MAASRPSRPTWRGVTRLVRGGRGRLRLGLALRGGALAVRALAVRGRGLRARRAPLRLAVVGVVEARPLEVDGHGVEHPADRRVAGLARCDRIVGHTLPHFERVTVLAPVFVDRHCFTEYRNGLGMSDVVTMDKI